MTKPLGPGYKSDINLPLPQLPRSTDPAIFNELIDVYNSVHTLNASRQQLTDQLYNTDPDAPYPEQMRFSTSLWLPATEPISQGSICAFVSTGAIKGIAGPRTTMALSSAVEAGEPVKLGFGPAIIELPGSAFGSYYYSHPTEFRGQLLSSVIKGSIRVAWCFTPGYVLFAPNWFN